MKATIDNQVPISCVSPLLLPPVSLLKPKHLVTAGETLISEIRSGLASKQRFDACGFRSCSCSGSSSRLSPASGSQRPIKRRSQNDSWKPRGRRRKAEDGRLAGRLGFWVLKMVEQPGGRLKVAPTKSRNVRFRASGYKAPVSFDIATM